MKRKFQHPEQESTGRRYWRSLDELSSTPGFQAQLEREFPEGASSLEGVDRRQFFKLMAASFALGGVGLATGCRRPEANVLPYSKSVEEIIPGLPLYYATAFAVRKNAIPVLAETHQGRPTKIEGNPTYGKNGSATSLAAQASVLELYDPDRATTHTIKGSSASAAQIQDLLSGLGSGDGAGLAILADESSSLTRARLVKQLKKKLPKVLWAEYEPVQDEAPVAAAKAAFGKSVKPLYSFDKARRIVAIDADFFHNEAGSLTYTRDFSKGRRVVTTEDEMNRLYAIESAFTLTGSMADHRLRLGSSEMLAFAAALAAAVTGNQSYANLAEGLEFNNKDSWIAECAKDLKQHGGESIVIAGAHQPAEVHAIVYAINAALGNIGHTIDFVAVEESEAATIQDLAKAITGGSVQKLVILGGNPVYNAPADLKFAELIKTVPQVIRHGYFADETAQASSALVTAAHYLESWGDARTVDGTIVPVQPMILPLFGGYTQIEVLAYILGLEKVDGYTLVHETITALPGVSDEGFRKFLHDGVLEGTAYAKQTVSFNGAGIPALLANAKPHQKLSAENLEVRFITDHKIDDGRFANNGWLQECPDPITKITWDNAIYVSPRLGKQLGIEPSNSLLQVARKQTAEYPAGRQQAFIGILKIGDRVIKGPLAIQPGLANFTVVLPVGYGRTVSGRVGKDVGHDFYQIRTSSAQSFEVGATLEKTEELYELANTQEHWSMEGRGIVREANLEEYKEEPGFVAAVGLEAEAPPIYGDLTPEEFAKLPEEKRAAIAAARTHTQPRGNSLYETPEFYGVHQWGMSIDLNTCIGCNACVVACQAENNIPIVGKEQVLRGREMHWIRLDRYYSDGKADAAAFGGEGNKELPEDPQVSLQPVGCQHCELAPCETVCPVNATVHDQEGLNVMAYNRCIGTRYCANNCPYKVRRFNFFDWNKRQLDSLYLGPLGPSGMPELVKMVKNPDVTVRMRGVMEKCTYCVQRIQQAKIAQKVKAGASDNVEIPDGTIKTACQQVCPAEAIVFGNVKDPESAVSKAKAREQDYALLGYLNTRPRTTYLGKLRNPNPAMPDYMELPFSRQEYNAKNHPAGHGEGHGENESHEEHAPAHNEEASHEGHASLSKLKIFGGLS